MASCRVALGETLPGGQIDSRSVVPVSLASVMRREMGCGGMLKCVPPQLTAQKGKGDVNVQWWIYVL